jgi:hypothetical protein
MTIIVRKTHKKDGKRIWIRVGESPPIIKDGKIKDGAFFVIVGDDEGEKMIRLTDQEALDIANRIILVYNMHIKKYRELDKILYREYKLRMDSESLDEEEEEEDKYLEAEILEFLIKSKGETTIEEIRRNLGVKHADYLNFMEKLGMVKIIENKVKLNLE